MDEFHDWEVLQPNSVSESGNQIKFAEFGADSDGMIRNDYFSVGNEDRYVKTVAADSVNASENLNRIEPDPREGSGEFSPELEVDRSENRTVEEFEGKGEIDSEKIQGGFEGIDEIGNSFEEFKSGLGGNEYGGAKFDEFEDKELVVEKEENEVFADKEDEIVPIVGETMNKIIEVENNLEDFKSNWGGNEAKFEEFEDKELVVEKEENEVLAGGETMEKVVEVEEKKAEVVKKSVVWWKVPFELLKYYMFRVRPMWTFSMAAALIGFAILGRRIYKVKKKARSLELKVTMDDKKVSQFMSRAARLNEAFSVVKRVPVIRSQLPATGVAPWPVMTKLALQEA